MFGHLLDVGSDYRLPGIRVRLGSCNWILGTPLDVDSMYTTGFGRGNTVDGQQFAVNRTETRLLTNAGAPSMSSKCGQLSSAVSVALIVLEHGPVG
jgi:hypothetical protein